MAKNTSSRNQSLRVEALEAREVPATGVLSGSTLTIEGTENADNIVARVSNGQVSFSGVSIRDGRRFTDSVKLSTLTSVVILARGGNDYVNLASLPVPAQIFGGDGNDQLIGGPNRDTIYGDKGNDTIRGGSSNDWLVGGEGDDVIYGGAGNDWISGDPGRDRLYGESGDDTISGGEGRDTLSGGSGTDRLDGSGFAIGKANTEANFDVYMDDFVYSKPINTNSDTTLPVSKVNYNQTGLSAVFSALNATDIRNAISSLGGREYAVKLRGDNKSIRVSFDGSWNDNDPTPIASSTAEFWPILLFRARMQSFGINPAVYRTDAEWKQLNASHGNKLFDPADALRQFTGRTTSTRTPSLLDFKSLQSQLSQKHAAVAVAYSGSPYSVNSTGVSAGVTYAIRQVFTDTKGKQWVQLYNPQGVDTVTGKRVDNNPYLPKGNDGLITLSWTDFRKSSNFSKIVYA